jgi:ribosomal protein L11 methyltransferase
MPYHQLTITLPARLQERLIGVLMRHHSLGVLQETGRITAYFPVAADLAPLMRELEIVRSLLERMTSPAPLRIEHCEVPDQDWNESWKRSFRPVDVGERFVVLPPWESASGGRIPLVIDPGQAFGTGHHETTRSCLVLMERYADHTARKRFLDVGTGTGLLAIAAIKLGFPEVEGIDTDPLAIAAAKENAAVNGASALRLREGDISRCTGPYDLIAANLIAGTLATMAGDLASRLAADGYAILAGILSGQEGEVAAACGRAGLGVAERYRDGKWISLVVALRARGVRD